MAPPRIRRALPRQGRQGEKGTGENHSLISGCCPTKIRLSARFLAARASVVVWFSKRLTQPLGQSDLMGVNKSSVR
nr:hypothetical protein [Bactrian camel astrovirus]